MTEKVWPANLTLFVYMYISTHTVKTASIDTFICLVGREETLQTGVPLADPAAPPPPNDRGPLIFLAQNAFFPPLFLANLNKPLSRNRAETCEDFT